MIKEVDLKSEASGLRSREMLLRLVEDHGPGLAFLRFERAGLIQSETSDWDVACRDLDESGFLSEKTLGNPLLRVRHQYVEQRYFEWGQLDLLPVFEWNGRSYLEKDRFWERVRDAEDGIPRPCLAHDAVIAWLTGALWGARYNSKYDPLLRSAFEEDRPEMEYVLTQAFGKKLSAGLLLLLENENPGAIVDVVGSLRRSLTWRALFSQGGTAAGRWVSHWMVELRNHLRPPFPWIAFLGPDGSGKSSVIQGVKDHFRFSRIGIVSVHWRPRVRAGLGGGKGEVVTDPHGIPPRGKFLSVAALVLLLVRWWAGLLLRVLHVRATKSMMISDRYYHDLIVDPRHYRYGGPMWLAKWIFRLIPAPAKTIILLTDAETILARKAEVSPDELERQLGEYRNLSEELGAEKADIVNVGSSLEEVVQDACTLVKEVLQRSS